MEDLPASSKRGEDIPTGDISCRENGSTLITCLACLEEVACALCGLLCVWKQQLLLKNHRSFCSLPVGLLHDETR